VAYIYSPACGPKLISADDMASSTSECEEYQVHAFLRQSKTRVELYTTYIDTSVTAVTVNCVDNQI
jgi:hypothetical protein